MCDHFQARRVASGCLRVVARLAAGACLAWFLNHDAIVDDNVRELVHVCTSHGGVVALQPLGR